MARYWYRAFTKAFSRGIVKDAYRAILRREPDPAGMEAHERQLKQHGRLVAILTDMSHSEEAWEKSLFEHPRALALRLHEALVGGTPDPAVLSAAEAALAEARDFKPALQILLDRRPGGAKPGEAEARVTVQAIFRGLLGRAAEPEAEAAYVGELRRHGDLAALLDEVAASPEHLQRVVALQAEALVAGVFRALLEREADDGALLGYGNTLRETRDLFAVVREVGQSREHRNLLLRRLAQPSA